MLFCFGGAGRQGQADSHKPETPPESSEFAELTQPAEKSALAESASCRKMAQSPELGSDGGFVAKEDAIEWTNRFLLAHRDLWSGWEGEADIVKVFGPDDYGAAGVG